eukprot:jgi/Ulvmu1/6677/UM030_0008.1
MVEPADDPCLRVHIDLEQASCALICELRQMSQDVEKRITAFQKEIKGLPGSSIQQRRREKLLRQTAEEAAVVERCLDEECKKLEDDEPLSMFRHRIQASQRIDQRHTDELLEHLRSFGLDLAAVPSVSRWQGRDQENELRNLQACSAQEDVRREVERRFEQSPLARHCIEAYPSSSAFDVAQSPAMGVLNAGVTACAEGNRSQFKDTKFYSEDSVVEPQCRAGKATYEETKPRVKNWATLQEQNEKLAAILAQHNITLNLPRSNV